MLEIVQLAEILTCISAVVAVVAFIYQIKRDKTLAAVDQVTFFREKIIPAEELFYRAVRKFKNNDKFNLPQVRFEINNLDLTFVKHDDIDSAKVQANSISFTNEEIMSSLYTLINLLEEFSLRVIHMKCDGHEALNCIHDAFIHVVEETITAILAIQIGSGRKTYNGIFTLYLKWRDVVDRRPLPERMEDFKKGLKK